MVAVWHNGAMSCVGCWVHVGLMLLCLPCRHALDLLGRMLQRQPADRITIDEILCHPWFGKALQSVAQSVNKGLLEMPDSMLVGEAFIFSDIRLQPAQSKSAGLDPRQSGYDGAGWSQSVLHGS